MVSSSFLGKLMANEKVGLVEIEKQFFFSIFISFISTVGGPHTQTMPQATKRL